jgi:hypothetical protein
MGRVNLTTLVDEDVRPRSADRPPVRIGIAVEEA